MFDTEKFIGEIEKRPAIYDIRSKVYSNRVAKLRYWHEVGKEMYRDWDSYDQLEKRSLVKELQIKWKSIRDHFMRQLKQNVNGDGPKKKKYVHFDQLQFLTANFGAKRSRNSIQLSHPDEFIKQEYVYPDVSIHDESPPPQMHPIVLPYVPTPHAPSTVDSDGETQEEHSSHDLSEHSRERKKMIKKEHHLKHLEIQDLSYHRELEGDKMGNRMFLLSLFPIMEQLPPYTNLRVRLQLMQVLQSAIVKQDIEDQQKRYQDYPEYEEESSRRFSNVCETE